MFPLLLMFGVQVGTGVMLNKSTFDNDIEAPKILGVNAYVAAGVTGLVMMFLGGPFALAGAAALGATFNNYDARKRVLDGIKGAIRAEVDQALAERQPAQLPGPVDLSLPVPPEVDGGNVSGSVLDRYLAEAA